jgi:hypothetical protein
LREYRKQKSLAEGKAGETIISSHTEVVAAAVAPIEDVIEEIKLDVIPPVSVFDPVKTVVIEASSNQTDAPDESSVVDNNEQQTNN